MGHGGIVKQLLRCGKVNTEVIEDTGTIPISLAIIISHNGVVEQLSVFEGTDTRIAQNYGRIILP